MSLQRSLGNKYTTCSQICAQYSVRHAAGSAFILLSFGFDLFGARKHPSSCRPEPPEHDSTVSTEFLVAIIVDKTCFGVFLQESTCNLELSCCADHFTVILLITRVYVERRQRQ